MLNYFYIKSTVTFDKWYQLVNLETSFDFNLQIKDLPTGQLAEAVITKYDNQGRPNGGTLLISPDANGKGWYIDPTPGDNSEFNQTLSDAAYRASTDSAAYGHYHDLPL